MKNTIPSQELLFTSEDKSFLNDVLLPKDKKTFILLVSIFTIVAFIAPYMSGKFGQKPLIYRMSYFDAVVRFGLFFSLIIWRAYHCWIVRLKKDISEGYKYIYQTKIERKSRINNDKYEIRLQLNPDRNGQKIYLKRPECYDWQLGDTIEVEFLKHTGTFLILKNTTQNQVFQFKD